MYKFIVFLRVNMLCQGKKFVHLCLDLPCFVSLQFQSIKNILRNVKVDIWWTQVPPCCQCSLWMTLYWLNFELKDWLTYSVKTNPLCSLVSIGSFFIINQSPSLLFNIQTYFLIPDLENNYIQAFISVKGGSTFKLTWSMF